MARFSIQQVRGLKDLIQETVEAGTNAAEQVHQSIAKQPYAVLKRIPLIAPPARIIERCQHALTSGIYQSIRVVNQVSGSLATKALDHLEEKPEASGQPEQDHRSLLP
ncbi:MAG: hypothetical protein V2J55_10750 [Candidatus Competibacteraceae bacterium]|jgi:hypothetical protein|nr:hypothetical protein [Candidatus Competibacteraceae bacterium]